MNKPTAAETAWAEGSAQPAAGALCIRAAAAVNRLDAGILEPLLAKGCTYGAQSAQEELHGRDAVLDYLGAKFETLGAAGPRGLLTAELAADPGGTPCVLLRQRSSAYGRPGLGSVSGYWAVAARPDGTIGQIYMVSAVPPPEKCVGAGLFPGLTSEEVEAHRHFAGERIPLSGAVTFLLFAKPRVSQCDEMVRAVPQLAQSFPAVRFRVVTPSNREACIEHGVTGFPAIHVQWRGETVRTLDGHLTNEQIREALADLFEH